MWKQPEWVSCDNTTPFMRANRGQDVGLKLSRTCHTAPRARVKADDCGNLVNEEVLRGVSDVPGAARDTEVAVSLTKGTIWCSMELGASKGNKCTSARVNWLALQLTKAETNDRFVKSFCTGKSEETKAPLETLMNDAKALDSDTTNVVPSRFEVFYMVDLARCFTGDKVLIDKLEVAVPRFFELAWHRRRAWVRRHPRSIARIRLRPVRKTDPVKVEKSQMSKRDVRG